MDHSDVLNRNLPLWESVVYGMTAAFAVISNLVLCVIIIKGKRASFDKSDILLLFNIAIAGLLTGTHIAFPHKNWQFHKKQSLKVTSHILSFLLVLKIFIIFIIFYEVLVGFGNELQVFLQMY